jgi:cytoskeletal protein CcmA (bactofilin family)
LFTFTNAKDRHVERAESTLVSVGTVVAGDIFFSGNLRIDGVVRGDVRCLDGQRGILIVGERGSVDGDVEVDRAVVSGSVTGRIVAREVVSLFSKARVDGDVAYAALEIHAGALVQGRLLQLQHDAAMEDSPQPTCESEPALRAASR